MGMKLYVGNLSFNVESSDLSAFFEQYGSVTSAKIISDRETGRSKGFGFVEMDDESEGKSAIERSNGAEFQGRNLKVSEAQPLEARGPKTYGGNPRSSNRW